MNVILVSRGGEQKEKCLSAGITPRVPGDESDTKPAQSSPRLVSLEIAHSTPPRSFSGSPGRRSMSSLRRGGRLLGLLQRPGPAIDLPRDTAPWWDFLVPCVRSATPAGASPGLLARASRGTGSTRSTRPGTGAASCTARPCAPAPWPRPCSPASSAR